MTYDIFGSPVAGTDFYEVNGYSSPLEASG
jgi:hypothetical protein